MDKEKKQETKQEADPRFKLNHLSITQIEMFLRCPFQWYCRYIEGIKRPPSASLTFGKAFDAGISENYTYKIKHGKDLPVKDVQGIFAASFDEQSPQTEWRDDENPSKIKDNGIEGVNVFHNEVCHKVIPIEVQSKKTIGFQNTNVEFTSIIDTIEKNGTISDTKTAAKSWSLGAEYKKIQPVAYSLVLDGNAPTKRIFRFDILIRTKKPKVQPIPLEIGLEQRQGFLLLLSNVISSLEWSIKSGVFYPRTDHNLCSRKYCGYWRECEKAWKIKIKD